MGCRIPVRTSVSTVAGSCRSTMAGASFLPPALQPAVDGPLQHGLSAAPPSLLRQEPSRPGDARIHMPCPQSASGPPAPDGPGGQAKMYYQDTYQPQPLPPRRDHFHHQQTELPLEMPPPSQPRQSSAFEAPTRSFVESSSLAEGARNFSTGLHRPPARRLFAET